MVRCKVKPDHIDSVVKKRKCSSLDLLDIADDIIDDDPISDLQSIKKIKKTVLSKEHKRGKVFEKLFKNHQVAIKLNSITQQNDPIYTKTSHCLLGEIKLELIDAVYAGESHNHWLFLNEDCDKSILYFNIHKQQSVEFSNSSSIPNIGIETYFYITGNLNFNLWLGLGIKTRFELFCYLESSFCIAKVYMLKSSLFNAKWPTDICRGSPGHSKTTAYVVKHFFGTEIPIIVENKTSFFDPGLLYSNIKKIHQGKTYSEEIVQHAGLIPKLRPYQSAAVKWMLFLETSANEEIVNELHPLFIELIAQDGTILFYNKYGGFFVKDKPLYLKPCPGGILADEMGLGKTVEILACILNNPRKVLETDNPIKNSNTNKSHPNVEELSEERTDLTINETGQNKRVHNDVAMVEFIDMDVLERPVIHDRVDAEGKSISDVNSEDFSNDFVGSNEMNDHSCFDNIDPVKCEPEELYSDSTIFQEAHSFQTTDSINCSVRKAEIHNDSSMNTFIHIKCEPDIFVQGTQTNMSDSQYSSMVCEPINSRLRISEPIFDKEISECPVRNAIEKVILEKVWNFVLKDFKKHGTYKLFRDFLRKRKKDPYYLMSLRERLNFQYLNSISSFSATYALAPGSAQINKDFFATKVKQKSFFECVCGNRDYENEDRLTKIQCSMCKLYQHAECVHYDMREAGVDKFICPHCWSLQIPVPSRATLIISPSSICYQWDEEIKKHISQESLNVFIYDGVNVHGYLQPKVLAKYDMVITTYEVLRRELNYTDLPHSNSEAGRRFRHPKRFMAVPSPLPCIDWWRVCLDEAQMVESASSRSAEMCRRLKCQIKWCITGTPIQKSISDLQGLLQFLEVDPYGIPIWWQRCLYIPYCKGDTQPLHDVIGKFMWRTSKIDVLDQLGIPALTEKIHWLNFTPVEEHFYKRLHSKCSLEATLKINKFVDKNLRLSSLDRKVLNSLLQPLLKMRQACDHPQIVKGIFMHLNRTTLTMEELLENLIKKTKLEAEDSHRIIIASLNGLAAIHVMKEEFQEAIAVYREALQAISEEGKNLKTDLLQRLHTIYNLNELLNTHKETTTEKTLRDDNLNDEVKSLREQYLKKYPEKIATNKVDCNQQTQAILDLQQNNYCSDWWLAALEAVDQEFVQEVRDELLASYSRFQEHQCILYSVESRVQLMRLMKVELHKLETQRKDMIKEIKALSQDSNYEKLLNSAVDCHLRPTDINAPKCVLCKKHDLFENLEQTLFFVKDEKLNRITDSSKEINDKIETLESLRKGNWGLSELERILKFLQTKSLGRIDNQEDAQTHLQIFQLMKKEFKLYRVWWRSIYDYISALDEVNMATLRYRLRCPDEKVQSKKNKNDLETKQTEAPTYVVDESELPQMELKLKSDKIISTNELRAKLGQLLYLDNLKKSDLGRKGKSNPEPCPICEVKLGEKWAVLNCGHSFCLDCMAVFVSNIKSFMKCAMCRQLTHRREVSYIDTKITEFEESIKVHGSLSTKIEGIVRTVLKIKSTEPEAKILVFSTWSDVLEVVADGFTQNGITHRILNSNPKFKVNLKAFRTKQEITALLIPLSLGSNGLNLIEAQHIIMVEPVLNHGTEVQAIGRIHRIGQTKSTFVHRFIVHSTIEERIFKILNSKENSDDECLSTIENLQELFAQANAPNEALES